jgi:hypothetical protein
MGGGVFRPFLGAQTNSAFSGTVVEQHAHKLHIPPLPSTAADIQEAVTVRAIWRCTRFADFEIEFDWSSTPFYGY